MSKRHIIVGDGVTAAEFATTRIMHAGDTLTIIGPSVDDLGRGIAYGKEQADVPWRYAYLLNSPSISVDAEFSEWMPANWESLVERMSNRKPDWLSAAQYNIKHGQISTLNAPREIYGDFFHATVCKKLDAMREKNIQIQFIPKRVVNIESNNSELTVHIDDGHEISADSVDVATGGPQNQRFDGDIGERSFPELFGNEARITKLLGKSGSIICIGSGAAKLDLLRFCQSIQTESAISFTAISPSGTVLQPLRSGPTFNPAHYELNETFNTSEEFVSAIIALQQKALDSGHNFYETRVGLRSLFQNTSVNHYVPNITEARKVARPLFSHFQGGTRDSIDDFNRFLASGNTQIIPGKVLEIKHTDNHATVTYQNQDGHLRSLNATVVVNCAGPGAANNFDALTTKMLQRNWISICPQSGGILVGNGAKTPIKGLRYFGPAVTSVGDIAQPVPFYDAYRLRRAVQEFNQCK